MVVIIMGPSGAGKTTVGQALATRLGCRFVDADAFHTETAREKMASGRGLTDADRAPWLERLSALVADHAARSTPLVLACSALKASYRQRLVPPGVSVRFVWLDVPAETLAARLRDREGHFAGDALLLSQLADFEPPSNALRLTPASTDDLVEDIVMDLVGRA